MVHVRHRERRRLPGRSRCRRGVGQGIDRRGDRTGAHGPAVRSHARRQDRAAALWRPHAQLRRSARDAIVQGGRSHRPHDLADAVSAVHQAERAVLRRISGDRSDHRRQCVPRRGGDSDSHGRGARLSFQGDAARHRRLRARVVGHVERAFADGRYGGDGLSTRPAAGRHGVLPVPSDRHLQDGRAALGSAARRGRGVRQRQGRALHGALRAQR